MILVTGGTGLLGQQLIESLSQKNDSEIVAIYRSKIPTGFETKARWIQADLLDVVALEAAMENVQQVYHCAGLVSFSPKQKNNLHQVNVEGTANLVNACIDAGVRKLVHVSSVAALGRLRPGKTISEAMKWTEDTSNSEYGKTKFLGEMETWRGIGEGLNTVIVNPTIIMGKYGDWEQGSMAIFKNIYKGFPWYSQGSTGFVDAADVSQAMIELMNSNISGERFIISAENKTYQDLFFMIADNFGKTRPNKKVTPGLAALVWRLEKLKSIFSKKEPLITKETADTALTKVEFDNTKLLKALPSFAYTPLQKSVANICEELKIKYKLQ